MRAMKDSGVEWIGEIPQDWEVVRVKHAFNRKNEKAMLENPTVLSLARSGVKVRDISNNEGQLAESYYNYNPVEAGDLLLNPMDLYSGANCSVSKINGVISPAYVNLRNKEGISSSFYDYYFKVQYWMMALFAHGKGVSFENRWTLNTETLMNYPIVKPSYQVQQRIANYLDSKCSKIDSIIEKQKAVIEKLKEYKLSVINEIIANTRGIRCYLNNIGTLKNGLNFMSNGDTTAIKFLGVGDFKDYYILDRKEMFSDITINEIVTDDYLLRDGDVIFVRSNGSKDIVGRCVMVKKIDYPLTYSGFCIRFRNSREDIALNDYLLLIFRSPFFREQMERYSRGSNINNLNQAILSEVPICLPSMQEQENIVSNLQYKFKIIDGIIQRKQAIIDKLTEYKKSLIFEVVTGKKEV